MVAEAIFDFGRHTGVHAGAALAPRRLEPGDRRLTVYHSQQAPHMMQDLFAHAFRPARIAVRVICKDVGGSFGIKVHAYPDDFATVAMAILLTRPVKFVADRLESFTSDIHARDHRVRARIACHSRRMHHRLRYRRPDRHRPVLDVPRTSAIEGNQVVNLVGGPYRPRATAPSYGRVPEQDADLPVPRRRPPDRVAVTEGLVDLAPRSWAWIR